MNSDQLQKWALVAEICGGIAVVVTLLLLILETRENTEVLRAATYDEISADIANWRMQAVTDNELQEVIFIFNTEGAGALTPRQRNMNRDHITALFQHYERAFIQWRLGNLDDEAWIRFKNRICRFSGDAAFERNTGASLDQITTEEFRVYRQNECLE